MSDSTSLALYDRIASPMEACKQLGDWIHKSQLFGTQCTEQAAIIAMECLARRVPPMDLANTYHIIGNKLAMKADAMAGRFQSFGGKIKVVEKSDKRAAVDLTFEGHTTSFEFTAEQAIAEPSTYNYAKKDENEVVEGIADAAKRKKLIDAKKMSIKPKYATPRSLGQMLWARLISDSIRTVCPMVNAGTYAPEDFGATVSEEGNDDASTASVVVEVEKAVPSPPAGNSSYAPKEDPVQGFSKPPTETSASKSPVAAPPESADPHSTPCSTDQVRKIRELWDAIPCTVADQEAQLKKRQVNAVRSLTVAQAEQLIGNLQKALDKKREASAAAAASLPVPPAEVPTPLPDIAQMVKEGAPASKEETQNTAMVTDRAGEQAITRVKGLIADLRKLPGGEEVFAKIKGFLESNNRRLADLTVAGLQQLVQAIMQKNLELFFDFALKNPGKWSVDPAVKPGK